MTAMQVGFRDLKLYWHYRFQFQLNALKPGIYKLSGSESIGSVRFHVQPKMKRRCYVQVNILTPRLYM